MEKGHNSHALFLDVAKAFDPLDHKLLLVKLSAVGLNSSAVKWIAMQLFIKSSNLHQGRALYFISSSHFVWCSTGFGTVVLTVF